MLDILKWKSWYSLQENRVYFPFSLSDVYSLYRRNVGTSANHKPKISFCEPLLVLFYIYAQITYIWKYVTLFYIVKPKLTKFSRIQMKVAWASRDRFASNSWSLSRTHQNANFQRTCLFKSLRAIVSLGSCMKRTTTHDNDGLTLNNIHILLHFLIKKRCCLILYTLWSQFI